MSSKSSKGVDAALAALPTGFFGVDKMYAGGVGSKAFNVGVVQAVIAVIALLSLSISPLAGYVSSYWMVLSVFVLVVAILLGGAPWLYPEVKWAKTNRSDKVVGYVILGLFCLSLICSCVNNVEGYKKKKRGQGKKR